jgi:hypothetical protein
MPSVEAELKRRIFYLFAVTVPALLLAGVCLAQVKHMVLCMPGFPGTTAQAQPFVDKMLRHLESKMGFDKQSLSGVYLPDGNQGVARLEKDKPGLALVGPSVYAGQHSVFGMKVIAKVEVNGRGDEVYSVVTRKDGPGTLKALAGKKVSGVVVHDEKYVYNVLLDKAIDPGGLTLVSQKRPLKSLRDVASGKADAAIIDQAVKQHMGDLDIAADLRIIHTAQPVPAPAVVVMGQGAKQAKAFKKALVGMCRTPDGKGLCQTLTLSSIKAATNADYQELLKRYNR